jgi:hypothetical protein
MELPFFYHGPLGGLSALVYVIYLQKITRLTIPIQILVMLIKILSNIGLAALLIWMFHGSAEIYWLPIIKMASIMQITCTCANIGWKAYKNNKVK